MTTTPEQLQAWREEFESEWPTTQCIKIDGVYQNTEIRFHWQGYLRRCQETEQIMNLAKFGADVIEFIFPDDPELFAEWMVKAGILNESHEYVPHIEATIKELLK